MDESSGSVKDRAAKEMFIEALKAGKLTNKILIDATSGNTGIAYAMLGASMRIPIELALPENASAERKLILKNYGAFIHYTSLLEGTDGAQNFVKKLADENPKKYYYPDQYNNDNNWKAHYKNTGPEIWHQTDQKVTHFCAGIGTSGTFIGTSRFLKEKNVKCIAIHPSEPMHGLEGWKHLETAIVPGIYDNSIADENMTVETETSFKYAVAAARHLGLHISPSSAANIASAIKLAESLTSGYIVTVCPDNASKYLQDAFWDDPHYKVENPFQ